MPQEQPVAAADRQRHPGGPRLGVAVDADLEGQPSPTALGDDAAGATPDDEDGVIFDAVRVGQAEGVVTVNVQNAPGGAKLDAWVDFDNDGSWSAAEQVATDLAVGKGDTTIVYALPSSVTFAARYTRFRLSTAGGLQPTGAAMTGEVEDHVVNTRGAFTVVLPATGSSNDVTVRLNGSHPSRNKWRKLPACKLTIYRKLEAYATVHGFSQKERRG